jgi:hypothetical protein
VLPVPGPLRPHLGGGSGKRGPGAYASVRVSVSHRWEPSLTLDGDPTGGDDREFEPGIREEPVRLGPETQVGEHPRLKSSLPECAHSLFCAASLAASDSECVQKLTKNSTSVQSKGYNFESVKG